MSYTIGYSQMQQSAIGACFLASGGGGSYQVSTQILAQGVGPSGKVTVISLSEAQDSLWLCVCANMGAPDALFKTSNPYATGNALAGLAQLMQKITPGFAQFSYVCPVEVGAINTVSPLSAAFQKSLPVIDADGAGRSIPTLPLDTFAADALPLYPNCIASNSNPGQPFNTSFINIAGPAPEAEAEMTFLGVQMSQPFGGIAGLAMYAQQGTTLKKNPPVSGTLTDACQIGAIYQATSGWTRATQIVSYLQTKSLGGLGRAAAVVFGGYITNMVQATGGTDIGYIVVSSSPDGSSDQLWIYNQNENIFANGTWSDQPIVVGPDSVCYLPFDQGQAIFDNSDLWQLFSGAGYSPIPIYVVAAAAPTVVTQNQTLMASWQSTRCTLGYAGPYVQPWLQAAPRGNKALLGS